MYIPGQWKEKVCGLCGNYNDNATDDWYPGPECPNTNNSYVSIVTYSTAKERRKFVTLKLKKYVELRKYILHVTLTVYYTVSFTCNIYLLKST